MSKVVKVSMESIDTNDIFDYIFARCNFCHKNSVIKETTYKDSLQLGHGYFYCPFCVRNKFNYKKREHILLMDFKGIIGFYINYLYSEGSIYNFQIIDYIRKHSIAGLKNPIFSYDHESMLWFVDFTRVGSTKNKVPLESVIKNTENIIQSFEVNKNIKSCNPQKILDKYEESINDFYVSRKRPEGKRVLSPTLKNCTYRPQIDWDLTKEFKFKFNIDQVDLFPVGETYNILTDKYFKELDEPLIQELNVTIKERKLKGVKGFEGSVEIPGISLSKLTQKDGTTLFTERKSLLLLAKKTAKKLGLKLVVSP